MGEGTVEKKEDPGVDVNCFQRLKSEFRLKNFGLGHSSPRLFVTSQWGGYPWLYVGWRVVWALYHLGWIVYNWVDDALNTERPGTWLVYLTNWGYFLLTFNTLLQALVVCIVTCTSTPVEDRRDAWYLKMTWLVYTLASVSSILITVLFYGLLFDGHFELLSTVTHLLTSVYVILDLAVTAIPVRLLHVIYPVIFAVVYVVFSVIYWAADGVNSKGDPYIYEVLHWEEAEKAVPIAVGVILVGVPLGHLVLWSLYMLRVQVARCIGAGGEGEEAGAGKGVEEGVGEGVEAKGKNCGGGGGDGGGGPVTAKAQEP
ncbi:protein rolling stone-like [Babylonia areolata]|uniref:protein rolling stone-like n=1 Tax=Babylonia areolata TaxID=304850 RepID=UPI003FD3FBB0